jgi:hypothetical protein
VQDPTLSIFGEGASRVEFFNESPGKYSSKLFSFKTIRYLSGTVLIGVGQRTTAGWDSAVNAEVEKDPAGAEKLLRQLWTGLAQLRWIADVIAGDKTTAELRAHTYLSSAGVQYAIAYALHRALVEHHVSIDSALTRLAVVDFMRPSASEDGRPLSTPVKKTDTIFAGTLVDAETGKVGSGRPAWEAAGEDLLEVILKG